MHVTWDDCGVPTFETDREHGGDRRSAQATSNMSSSDATRTLASAAQSVETLAWIEAVRGATRYVRVVSSGTRNAGCLVTTPPSCDDKPS